MTARRNAARLAVLAASAVAATAAAPPPAHADPPATPAERFYIGPPPTTIGPSLTAPAMTILIRTIPAVGFDVCVSGSSTALGTWTADIDGARSDGSLISLSAPAHTGTAYAPPCLHVPENSTEAGEWTLRLAFTRNSVAHTRMAGGTWDTATHEHTWDTA